MLRPVLASVVGVAAGSALVVAVLAYGLAVGVVADQSTAATTYPCIRMGGGVWEERWNNSSGAGPTHVFVPMPGYWWAAYNNSTGAAAYLGWSTSASGIRGSPVGWTTV